MTPVHTIIQDKLKHTKESCISLNNQKPNESMRNYIKKFISDVVLTTVMNDVQH